jgi:hypothetical protein
VTVIYVATSTRPDVAFRMLILSRLIEYPGKQHWAALLRLVTYLETGMVNTLNWKIVTYKSKRQTKIAKSSTHSELIAVCDAENKFVSIVAIIKNIEHKNIKETITLHIDNANAIRTITTGYLPQPTRHLKLNVEAIE